MQARHFISFVLAAGLFVSPLLWADNLDPGLSLSRIMGQAQGVQVYTLPDGRVHAEINYQQQDNAQPGDDTKHKFTFEGTQAEVREQIENNTTLPEDKKQLLLQTLSGNPVGLFNQSLFGGGNPFDDPFFKNGPFSGNDPFMDDFFKNSPFNDDFFKKFFGNMPSFSPPSGFGSGHGQPQIPPSLSTPPIQVPPAAPAGEGKGILL